MGTTPCQEKERFFFFQNCENWIMFTRLRPCHVCIQIWRRNIELWKKGDFWKKYVSYICVAGKSAQAQVYSLHLLASAQKQLEVSLLFWQFWWQRRLYYLCFFALSVGIRRCESLARPFGRMNGSSDVKENNTRNAVNSKVDDSKTEGWKRFWRLQLF